MNGNMCLPFLISICPIHSKSVHFLGVAIAVVGVNRHYQCLVIVCFRNEIVILIVACCDTAQSISSNHHTAQKKILKLLHPPYLSAP